MLADELHICNPPTSSEFTGVCDASLLRYGYGAIILATLKALKAGKEGGMTPGEIFEYAQGRGKRFHGRVELRRDCLVDQP